MTKTKKRKAATKRHGETFAQQLAREHAEKQKFGYEVGMEVAKEVKQEVASDLMKLMVIAINREFGIGNERLRRLAKTLYDVTKEWDDLAGVENDIEYARAKVDERIHQIFGDDPVDFRIRY